jgi:DNA invertase Pin-like site-specific DNA recombinase
MIAAIYARKSNQQDVADELKSVAQQAALARRFAESRGWTVARIFEDDAISGAIEDRPGVVALRAALAEKPRPFDVVITADASRPYR